MSLRSILRDVRKAQEPEISQVDLVALSGVSLRTIQEIEAGRTMPSVETARKIAQALGVGVEDLFEEIAPRPRRRRAAV